MADGVLTMHNRGFSHRDIKVENVMINSTGMPILMDFGSVGPGKTPTQSISESFCFTINTFLTGVTRFCFPYLYDDYQQL